MHEEEQFIIVIEGELAELLAEGASVVICSRHGDELEATAAELAKVAASGAGVPELVAMTCDVTDPGQVSAFVEAAATPWAGWTSWSTTPAGRGRAGLAR